MMHEMDLVLSPEWYLENNASDFDASVYSYTNIKSKNTAWQ